MNPKTEEYIFYQGEKFQVEFYFNEKGELPAKEYFDVVDRQVKIKLLSLVKFMAEEGRLFEGRKIILTNAYRKKGQKMDGRELARAVNLKKDYELRVKGGVYYE